MQETALPESARNIIASGARSGIPDALLRDHWYVAEFGAAISRTPIRRTILNEPIAFYRTEQGGIVALYDRCPHRSYPLSRGEVRGDALICGYHGFTFDPSGACVSVPGQSNIPRAACVR
jgi:phenylpropionate dioxygenase-like ring-hydroxylating dioxygenase large terminal subunit